MPFDAAEYALGTGRLAQAGVTSGFELAQRDAQIKLQQDQARRAAEQYVAEHTADQRFLQAFADTLSQMSTNARTYSGQPLQPSSQPTPQDAGPPAGSMGPSTDAAMADQREGATLDLTPASPTLTPAQAAQGAQAAGANLDLGPAALPGGGLPAPAAAPRMGPAGPSAQEAAAPAAPAPAAAPHWPIGRPNRPDAQPSFTQLLIANAGPAALAHMSPDGKRMLESILGEQAGYMIRQQRETQDIRDMIGAQVFAYYNGDQQDPEGPDHLAESLWEKVKLGLITPEELIKNAAPPVAAALQNRMEAAAEHMRVYLSTDYTPGQEPKLDPVAYMANRESGYHTLQQQVAIKNQKLDQYHAQEGRTQETLEAQNKRLDTLEAGRNERAALAESGRNDRSAATIAASDKRAQQKIDFERWKLANQPPKGRSPAERGTKEQVEANRFQQTKVGNQIKDLIHEKGPLDLAASAKMLTPQQSQRLDEINAQLTKLRDFRNNLEDEANTLQTQLQQDIRGPQKRPGMGDLKLSESANPTASPAAPAPTGATPNGTHLDPAAVMVPGERVPLVAKRLDAAIAALKSQLGRKPTADEIGTWLDQHPE